MALEKEGSKTYALITDLPLITNITDGDEILVQTTSGTARIDFTNFIIPLSNCTFQSTFNEMSQSYSANSDLINKIGTSAIKVTNLSSVNDTLSDAVNQLSINFDGINDLVTNLSSKNNTLSDAINQLSSNFNNINNLITDNYTTLKNKLNEVITYINAHMSEGESRIELIGNN